MQRHPPHDEEIPSSTEGLPLLMRHISLAQESFDDIHEHKWIRWKPAVTRRALVYLCAAAGLLAAFLALLHGIRPPSLRIVPIQRAEDHMLDIGNGLSLWFRVWGNRASGIPVLFVHGGPGNCIADYGNENSRFFDNHRFFVIEVDQRGTGRSQPSIRDDCRNMKYYEDITIDQMSHDFELVRKALDIDSWLVFGGSWGSTLSLDYVERYPKPCLGLIVRGIWLNTRPEFDAIFKRSAYLSNAKRLAEFDTWFELAAEEAISQGGPELDPDDAERFFRINRRMIQRCDMHAIWRHFVWENNLMEEDPANLLDPYEIDYDILPEAMSVAFFENRIFLHGTFDEPMDLLSRVDRLNEVNTWVCQGLRDEVCPTKYGAKKLADALITAQVSTRAQFLDAGHEQTDPAIAKCLEDSVADFLTTM